VIPDPSPLHNRCAIVTGVSRRAGIGFAVAQRLLELAGGLNALRVRRQKGRHGHECRAPCGDARTELVFPV
jgi:NAD(P)-dependent dehydrogenase (short-subunit alcohol dehydrogenase family)